MRMFTPVTMFFVDGSYRKISILFTPSFDVTLSVKEELGFSAKKKNFLQRHFLVRRLEIARTRKVGVKIV